MTGIHCSQLSCQGAGSAGILQLLDELVCFLHLAVDYSLVVPIIGQRGVDIREGEVGIGRDDLVGRLPLPLMEHVHIPHTDAGTRDARFAGRLIDLDVFLWHDEARRSILSQNLQLSMAQDSALEGWNGGSNSMN